MMKRFKLRGLNVKIKTIGSSVIVSVSGLYEIVKVCFKVKGKMWVVFSTERKHKVHKGILSETFNELLVRGFCKGIVSDYRRSPDANKFWRKLKSPYKKFKLINPRFKEEKINWTVNDKKVRQFNYRFVLGEIDKRYFPKMIEA